jgi:formate hydrogenlyase subunit 3/multisubunit Na+/H+ antiporter MnhD subunit
MTLAELAFASGAAAVAAGGLLGTLRRGSGPGLGAQALGMTTIGLAAVVVAAGDGTAGAGFRSALRPALGVDRLSAIFLATLAMVAVPALVYARGSLARSSVQRPVTALTAGFLLAMVLVLTARDVTTLLAGWELMTVFPASAILVARGTDPEVRTAVLAYLALTHVGGAGTWAALLALAHAGAIQPAGEAALSPATTAFVAVAALIGFGTKAGLMPLHSWLPRAHPVAPSHLSALMSGVMVKVALYGLIRVLFQWLGPAPLWLAMVVLAVGLLSALGGVLYAVMEDDLKRLLAFSSIENVGIVTLGLGAALLFRAERLDGWAAIALGAALLHSINHAAFKALLFMAAGTLERAAGSLRLDHLGGLLRRLPWTGGAFLIGCAAIAGVPPLNGFASEWLTLQALVHLTLDQPVGIVVAGTLALAGLAMTAALGLYCFVKVVGLVLLGPPRTRVAAEATEAGASMRCGVAALAVACVALAALPGVLLPGLAAASGDASGLSGGPSVALPDTGGLPAPQLLVAFVVLVALTRWVRGGERRASSPVWVCGQPVVGALGWTSAGFTKPLRLVLAAVLRPEREIVRTEANGVLQRIAYRGAVPHLFDTHFHAPVVRTALRGAAVARRLQSGSVRTYAGYLLGVLIVALLLARWGVLG